MPEFLIRPILSGDVDYIINNLRAADRQEIESGAGGLPVDQVVKLSIFLSAYRGYCGVASKPAALFGVVPVSTQEAVVWLVGTDEMTSPLYRRAFLTQSLIWIQGVLGSYPVLTNSVSAHNRVHLKWIHWIGGTFTETIYKTGTEPNVLTPFHKFVIHKETYYGHSQKEQETNV